MKRILIISLILLPTFIVFTKTVRTYRSHRYEAPSAPLAPRPEAEPREPRRSIHYRFAWGKPTAPFQIAAIAAPENDQNNQEADEETPVADIDPPKTTRPSTGTNANLASDWMFSEERARADLHDKLIKQLSRWLVDSDVDPAWTPPAILTDRLLPTQFEIVEQDRDYARMYRASAPFSLSTPDRQRLVQEYDRQIAEKRLGLMGGVLAFVLACLGVTTAYVRTEEATRGFYTKRLRLIAAVSVGAAGVLLYDWLRRG